MRIDIPIGDYKDFQVLDMLDSYIEVKGDSIISVQRYYSKEVNEDDGKGGIAQEYYRDMVQRFQKSSVIGIEKMFYNQDDIWAIKIHVSNGEYLMYTLTTEATTNKIFQQLESIIFND